MHLAKSGPTQSEVQHCATSMSPWARGLLEGLAAPLQHHGHGFAAQLKPAWQDRTEKLCVSVFASPSCPLPPELRVRRQHMCSSSIQPQVGEQRRNQQVVPHTTAPSVSLPLVSPVLSTKGTIRTGLARSCT